MTNNPTTADLKNTWEMAAPGWAKWEHAFAIGFADATETLLDMAGVGQGMRVLDIASGAGSQSIAAARRVGPAGRVTASDISGTMLKHVSENARLAGIENIEPLLAAADELDPAIGPYDAAICRMGLMLFPSPQGALDSLKGVLRPGARFGALVFSTPANSPFLALPMAILLRHAGRPLPPPGSPGIFALGGRGVLENLLRDAGFADVETQTVQASIVLPSAEEALHLMQEAAGAYRAVIADLDDSAKARAWDEVYECLKQFDDGRQFTARLEAVVGAGTIPS